MLQFCSITALKAPSKINKYVLAEEAPYTTINISWTGEKNAKNINYIVILIYPHNELGWLPMQEMKNDECKVAPQPQVLQLFASDHNGKLVGHSEPVFLWPEEQEDKLILERREPNSVSVNVNIKEPINYTLSIYAYPNETAEEVIKDTSDRRKFPFTVQLRKKAVSYRFELLFETRDYYSRETVSYLLEEEGLPNEVEGAEIKAVTSEYSPTEHATFRVTWLPPSEPAGMIQKYKIRWKLERSPYTIYAEERCNITEYDLRLYWAEERYQVFISAATSKGYGPEKRLDVAIGSPPGSC
ncbi:unnamed protein product [Nippostrongylus brasiliensis]|uniref:Fibronectin type-III domain-containing protein n=1 Tax=Nippostrongylus brasiliensis TaxID=27835 RepID=A0A0N4XHJ4_NIPBR|nr:unnamed protein product [Nippostrongylus brasiliensis]